MRLTELFPGAPGEVEITDLAYDSRLVKPGALFFCVPGATADGHDFAAQAVERGASALVAERSLGTSLPELVVPSVREAIGPLAARFFGKPSTELSVAAVTGTNGKTTVAYLLSEMLKSDGRSCGLMGTIVNVAGRQQETAKLTTPEAIDLQRSLRRMVDAGDRACVMEVSSHGIAHHRIDGTQIAAAIFTNLTHEHLDFHDNMTEYFETKRRLFSDEVEVAVVNIDDRYGRVLAEDLPAALTFSMSRRADFSAEDVRVSLEGSSFKLRTPVGSFEARTPLIGRHNVSNALAAAAAAQALGAKTEHILDVLETFAGPPGRFERVATGQPFEVIVDYAHTPDALAQLLGTARKLARRQLICVFGCAGGRDRSTRAPMGKVASRFSDRVIVTTDDPSPEQPESIISDIMQGTTLDAEVSVDRRQAIAHALAIAQDGDMVVIAGRGHEEWQQMTPRYARPFCDRAVVRELLGLAAQTCNSAPGRHVS